jgi:DUF4097 and DUF4098 domain-containing protein YvlB
VIEKTFSVGDAPEVAVRIQSGRIELVEGRAGEIKATVVTKDPNFVVEQRGDLVDLHTDPESGWVTSKSSRVFLEVPPGADATLRVASAEINCQVMLGRVEIKSASGDIELVGAEKVIVKTASGDVMVDSVTEALRFASASGDLEVRKALSGSVVASTASGDITIGKTDAVVELNTVSGDATIERFVGRHLNVKSMSGSVDLGIPTGTKVDLDASLMSGRVNLPPPAPESTATGRHIFVKVKSVSGDLTINRLTD